jgi:hypothetical protein
MSENQQNIQNIYDETNVIYDGERYMIVEPLTKKSLDYFSNNKLYDWNGKFRDNGDLYLIIDKKWTPTDFYSIFIDNKGSITYNENGDSESITQSELLEKIPSEIFQKIEPILYKGKFYDYLLQIKNGVEYDSYDLRDVDELFGNIRFNSKNPNKSIITIEFPDIDDYLDVLNVEDDDRWDIRTLFGGYYGGGSLEIYPYDFAQTDWDEGYSIESFFNEENKSKLNEILKFIAPELINQTLVNDKITEKLNNLFPNESDDIIQTIYDFEDECRRNEFRKVLIGELCNVFEPYGIFEKYCFRTYYTSVGLLLSLYEMVGDKTLSIKDLLTSIMSDKDFSGYNELRYETYCSKEIPESVHQDISEYLDKMLEEIETSDKYENFNEYVEVYNYFDHPDSKYKFKKIYPTPKNPSVKFQVMKINPSNNKIIIQVLNKQLNSQQRELTLDEFNDFLYTGELF